MMRSPSTIKLTNTVLEIPLPKSGTEIELIGSLRPQPTDTIPEVPQAQLTGPVTDITPPSQPEKATKAGVDPKILASEKGGQEFKKIQDAEMKVLNREHSEKIKMSRELTKKRIEKYRWTTSSRPNPETITDVKIHPNTKLVAMIIFKDELREIIPKKKNNVVKDLMNFLSKRYERLRTTPDELGIRSSPILAPAPEQASSQLSGRKKKKMELEPEIRIPGLECDKSLLEGIPFVNNMVIKEPEYGMYVFGDEAFQRMSDIHKVDVDTLLSYLEMASNITTPENTRSCLAEEDD
ncbi:hypothetical protein Tco_1016639 [Tanacetum coccineum]|uniref:Uncharacterized protein n=1 Tax=Tanacetum coccineum TaxID=301880 RepID=A0ABQ5FPR2_9ASTR